MGEGTLQVVRNSPRDIKIRDLYVLVDGEQVGTLGYGETFDRQLPAGPHTISATNRLYTKTEEFDLKEGETVTFDTANVATGCGGLLFVVVGMGPYQVQIHRR